MKTTQDEPPTSTGYQMLIFGPFRLDPVQRVLRDGDKALRLGSRAFEILLMLAERAGEVVSKNELIARVWPGSIVQDATLRVHIAALRKALGDGDSGIRYVENFSGRGYRFVAHVIRRQETAASGTPAFATTWADNVLAPLTRIEGRAQVIGKLAARIPQRRLVTICGPGGMGKTTVAMAVADELSCAYEHGVRFVDLALLTDPQLVAPTLASTLGLATLAEDPMPGILAFLRDKSMLILLDNCEHLVEAATSLAEKVLQGAPNVHLLATSREPLRAESEYVHRLAPLESPEPSGTLSRADALAFPAIRLFVERAIASLDTFELHDADILFVTQICHELDGNPLAIELAAARVELLGVRGLAARLDDCLQLLTKGRRTALPRHRTLRATLDWSHGLLSASEQITLRRLALFPGSFDMESASAVAADERIHAVDVFDNVTNLVAKSLLTSDATGEQVRYRLLDTTRVFALEKLRNSNELAEIKGRHAEIRYSPGAAEARTPRKHAPPFSGRKEPANQLSTSDTGTFRI